MTAPLPDYSRPTRLARQLTEELTAEATELDARWAAAIRVQFGPPDCDRLAVLRGFVAQAEVGLGIGESARRLWAATGAAEPPAEVAAAVAVFERVAFQARKIEEHKSRPWVPRDPERLARALQNVREGRTVGEEEARAWFRPDTGGETR